MLKKIFSAKGSSKAKTPKHNKATENNDNIATHLYRKLSGSALDVAVKPQLVGEVPKLDTTENTLTFYVLKEYSRSNSVLIDVQTKEHKLPPSLVKVSDKAHGIYENAAIIFLKHPSSKQTGAVSPRLQRLVSACQQHPALKIQLVPVTIIWGRSPEKEDSLFKLLVADNWQEPSFSKQLFNIGVMGRDTFVEFHKPIDLGTLLGDLQPKKNTNQASPNHALITAQEANKNITRSVQQYLNGFLDKQRASVLGPDLSDRRNVVDKLLYSPAIKTAIEQESESSGKNKAQVKQVARGYLNEIATDYSYPVVRFFDTFLTWLWTQLYDGVEVQHFERVRELAADHEIIYVPCHRSHIDYLLLSFIIYKRGLRIPYVAAGDNLNIPVLGKILRSGGAFFMRRSFKGNALYSTVFKEYVHSIVERNNPIEYFIEGGRSRSGRLLPAKLGMISMTVQSHLRRAGKPVVFIPTYIGYERIMEGGSYIGELKGQPKESESLVGLLKTARKIERIFGTVHLSFGTPLYLSDFMQKFDVEPNSLPRNTTEFELSQNTSDMISNLGVKILQHINKAAVINPISLLSLVLLATPKAALDEESCQNQIALYQRLAKKLPYDADTTVTDMSPHDIIDYGIKLKLVERRQHILGDMIQVANNQAPLLSYFRNNILHVYILSSFLAALVERNGRISRERIDTIFELLYPFLQTELFLKYTQRDIRQTVNQKLENLIDQGIIISREDNSVGAPDASSREYQQLKVLATPVEQSLERYFMSLALLAQQGSGNLTSEQVVDLCHLLGQRLSVLYADDIPDSFDRALFTGFIDALIRLDYLQKDEETGLLSFDHRINDIAHHARYILRPKMMQLLQNIADLGDEDIEKAINELNAKKARRFSRKKK
ncbi:glycerol-3-phosphate 1-O-acyltransferase PlsB [Psychrobacter sp. HD31]|uniref:glycerol-3-phosphate 1-O-acyltransferase PlsB n=1 Tax=Psychrobacter sp. HD31 TaxID=3112003 RepID=UPI003DA3A4F3